MRKEEHTQCDLCPEITTVVVLDVPLPVRLCGRCLLVAATHLAGEKAFLMLAIPPNVETAAGVRSILRAALVTMQAMIGWVPLLEMIQAVILELDAEAESAFAAAEAHTKVVH